MVSTHRSVTINDCCTPDTKVVPPHMTQVSTPPSIRYACTMSYLSLMMIKIGSNAYHHSVMYINLFFNRYYPIR